MYNFNNIKISKTYVYTVDILNFVTLKKMQFTNLESLKRYIKNM